MSPLYRRLYDEGLTNPGFGGEVLRVDGCGCILFTGESDQPDTVRQLLLDEIERVRKMCIRDSGKSARAANSSGVVRRAEPVTPRAAVSCGAA